MAVSALLDAEQKLLSNSNSPMEVYSLNENILSILRCLSVNIDTVTKELSTIKDGHNCRIDALEAAVDMSAGGSPNNGSELLDRIIVVENQLKIQQQNIIDRTNQPNEQQNKNEIQHSVTPSVLKLDTSIDCGSVDGGGITDVSFEPVFENALPSTSLADLRSSSKAPLRKQIMSTPVKVSRPALSNLSTNSPSQLSNKLRKSHPVGDEKSTRKGLDSHINSRSEVENSILQQTSHQSQVGLRNDNNNHNDVNDYSGEGTLESPFSQPARQLSRDSITIHRESSHHPSLLVVDSVTGSPFPQPLQQSYVGQSLPRDNMQPPQHINNRLAEPSLSQLLQPQIGQPVIQLPENTSHYSTEVSYPNSSSLQSNGFVGKGAIPIRNARVMTNEVGGNIVPEMNDCYENRNIIRTRTTAGGSSWNGSPASGLGGVLLQPPPLSSVAVQSVQLVQQSNTPQKQLSHQNSKIQLIQPPQTSKRRTPATPEPENHGWTVHVARPAASPPSEWPQLLSTPLNDETGSSTCSEMF